MATLFWHQVAAGIMYCAAGFVIVLFVLLLISAFASWGIHQTEDSDNP